MGVNSLPKTVTRQRRDCDLNPGPKFSTRAAVHTYSSSRIPFREPELSSVQFMCCERAGKKRARELSAADRRRGCK